MLECDLDRVIGVINLKAGQAVHAIAGNRRHYRPVAVAGGDPVALAEHYKKLGVSRLYLADLDAIEGHPISREAIVAVCSRSGADEILLDVGWQGAANKHQVDAISKLAFVGDCVSWIAATESSLGAGGIRELADLVGPQHVRIGLDYRGGRLLANEAEESTWIRAAVDARCVGAVVLDLNAVGTKGGPLTTEPCSRIRSKVPAWEIFSGGGVRCSADVDALLDAGCNAVLVATALQQED